MILTSKCTPKPDHVIKSDGHKLEEVQDTQFLHNKISWKHHIDYINRYFIARFMYRWYLNHVPDLFHDFLTPVSEMHSHFTRQSDGLFIATFKTNLGKTCLSWRGTFIWNKILG